MKIKMRYLWAREWHYIDFSLDNLRMKFREYENRVKTTRLELWTGLLDKQGKEIYEGDILDHGDNNNSVVVWINDEAKFELKETINGNEIRYHEMNYLTYKPEILGNIYNNPELLKEELE